MEILTEKEKLKLQSINSGNLSVALNALRYRNKILSKKDAHILVMKHFNNRSFGNGGNLLRFIDWQPLYVDTYKKIIDAFVKRCQLANALFVAMIYQKRLLSEKEINYIFSSPQSIFGEKVMMEFLRIMRENNRNLPFGVVRYQLRNLVHDSNTSLVGKLKEYEEAVSKYSKIDPKNKLIQYLFDIAISTSKLKVAIGIKKSFKVPSLKRREVIKFWAKNDGDFDELVTLLGEIPKDEKKYCFKKLRDYKKTLRASSFAADHLDIDEVRSTVRALSQQWGMSCSRVSLITE